MLSDKELKQYKQIEPLFDILKEVIKNTTFYCGNVREVVSDTLYDEGIVMTQFMYNIIMINCSESAFKPIDPITLAYFKD